MDKQAGLKEPSKESESRPYHCLTMLLEAVEDGTITSEEFRKATSKWRKEYRESSGKILFGAVSKESE